MARARTKNRIRNNTNVIVTNAGTGLQLKKTFEKKEEVGVTTEKKAEVVTTKKEEIGVIKQNYIKFDGLKDKLKEVSDETTKKVVDILSKGEMGYEQLMQQSQGFKSVSEITKIINAVNELRNAEMTENNIDFFNSSFGILEKYVGEIEKLQDHAADFKKLKEEFDKEAEEILGATGNPILQKQLDSLQEKMNQKKEQHEKEIKDSLNKFLDQKEEAYKKERDRLLNEFENKSKEEYEQEKERVLREFIDDSMLASQREILNKLIEKQGELKKAAEELSNIEREIQDNQDTIDSHNTKIANKSTKIQNNKIQLITKEAEHEDKIKEELKEKQNLNTKISDAQKLEINTFVNKLKCSKTALYNAVNWDTKLAAATTAAAILGIGWVSKTLLLNIVANGVSVSTVLPLLAANPVLCLVAIGGISYMAYRFNEEYQKALGVLNDKKNQKIKKLKDEISELEEQERTRIQEMNKLRNKIIDAEQKIRDLEGQIGVASREIEFLKEQKKHMQEKVNNLKNEIKEIKEKNKGLSDKADKYIKEFETTKAYIDNMNKYMEELKDTDVSLNDVIAKVLNLDDKQAEVLKLYTKYQTLFESINNVTEKVVNDSQEALYKIRDFVIKIENNGVPIRDEKLQKNIQKICDLSPVISKIGRCLGNYNHSSKITKEKLKKNQVRIAEIFQDEKMNVKDKVEQLHIEMNANFNHSRILVSLMDELSKQLQNEDISELASIYGNIHDGLKDVKVYLVECLDEMCKKATDEVKKISTIPDEVKEKIAIVEKSALPKTYKGAKIFFIAYSHCFEEIKKNSLFGHEELEKYSPEAISKEINLNKYEDTNLNVEAMKIIFEKMDGLKATKEFESFLNVIFTNNIKPVIEESLNSLKYFYRIDVSLKGIANIISFAKQTVGIIDNYMNPTQDLSHSAETSTSSSNFYVTKLQEQKQSTNQPQKSA